jgi:hypothetical protein
MSESHMSGRSGDPAIKWLVGGTLVVVGLGVSFLGYLVDTIRFIGPSGAMAILGIGVASCAAFGAVAFGPVGRAVGKRILSGGTDRGAIDDDLHDLRLQVEDLRNALLESQERLDFTERMLAGGKERAPEELH